MVNDGDGPFGPVVNGTQIVFYEYRPNAGAAWTFVVLFAIGVVGHVGYFFWLRAWHFLPFILGGVGEAFGYYGRAKASENPLAVGPFIMQNLLILGSPPLFAATIYMSLGRIIIALDLRRHAAISPRLTAFFYVVVDIGCFVSQVLGSVMPASGDPSAIDLSKKIIMGGLLAQLGVICLFALSCAHSHRWAKREAPNLNATHAGINWNKYYLMTYGVALLMFVRSLVRGIEYLQGEGGYIIKHEFFVYAFDAALMVAIMALYLWIHPGRLVRDLARYKSDAFGDERNIMLERR
ncbi:Protoporphyrin uptake protein 1 [Colletotrichum sp. SAR11_239]|nr:Protoporphyrin uptake protein 1 [Colletotrichum sp. SAR 10_75]KAI8215631.1 Protoporphyrin uptake protein 1 [Colletotrichum sp. SAR 10_76]KAI8270840.1 Protoporphyrin uptake protein 1 [Colletotrichum sp. SAR11_239]KAJ5003858.1 Protoporphyrin uptake protein 1 [Colletotrichum sp. SAR 10_66]